MPHGIHIRWIHRVKFEVVQNNRRSAPLPSASRLPNVVAPPGITSSSPSSSTKAYVDAVPKRATHTNPPGKLGMQSGMAARPRKCAYGTLDAGLLREQIYSEDVGDTGFA